MKQYVILGQSYRNPQSITHCCHEMDFETEANLTVHYHSQRELAVLIESTSFFIVVSVVFSILKQPDNLAVIIDFDSFTELSTPWQETPNHGIFCVRKYIPNNNITNQTYICPYTQPKSSQNLAVLAEEVKEDMAKYVSTGAILMIQSCIRVVPSALHFHNLSLNLGCWIIMKPCHWFGYNIFRTLLPFLAQWLGQTPWLGQE